MFGINTSFGANMYFVYQKVTCDWEVTLKSHLVVGVLSAAVFLAASSRTEIFMARPRCCCDWGCGKCSSFFCSLCRLWSWSSLLLLPRAKGAPRLLLPLPRCPCNNNRINKNQNKGNFMLYLWPNNKRCDIRDNY